MKGKFRILGRIGLGVFMVCALMLAFLPVAPVSAATEVEDVWVEFPSVDGEGDIDGDMYFNKSASLLLYRIHFKPTTALKKGVDTITVQFPDGLDSNMGPVVSGAQDTYDFELGSACSSAGNFDIDPDGPGIAYDYFDAAKASYGGYRITVKTQVDIPAGNEVWLMIDDASNMVTSAAEYTTAYKVKIHTSQDTTPVLSKGFYLGDDQVGSTTDVSLSPNTAGGENAQYEITFTPGETLAANSDTITVTFPYGTTVPSSISASAVSVYNGSSWYTCGLAPTIDTDLRTVKVTTPQDLTTGERKIKFASTAGITNPTGVYTDYGDDTAAAKSRIGFIHTSDEPMDRPIDTGGYAITYTSASKLNFNDDAVPSTSYSDKYTMVNMYSSPLYLQVEDTYGNKVTAGSYATAAVTPSSSSTTGKFYTVSGSDYALVTSTVTLSGGGATLYYYDSTAGTHTLSATYSGLTSASWTMQVAPAVSIYDSNNNLITTYGPTSTDPAEETSADDDVDQHYAGYYIRQAVDAAMDGDTVKLGDGTYDVDSVITIDGEMITLTSVNGAAYTTLIPTSDAIHAIAVSYDGTAANPVVIDGLTFDRLRSGTEFDSAVFNNSGKDYMTVRNCVFNYVNPNANTDSEAGIWVNAGETITSCTISNNTFTNCNPFSLSSGKAACICIMGGGGQTSQVSGVSITGNTFTDCYQKCIEAKGNSTKDATVSMTNNTFTDCYWAIEWGDYASTTGCTITGNTMTRCYGYAIKIAGEHNNTVTIKNNTITGTATCTYYTTRDYAVRIEKIPESSGHVYVQYNAIYDNNGYNILVDDQTGVTLALIDCRYNWYGDASGPAYTAATGATVGKSNPDGTGDAISDRVFYYPWLHKSLADVVADNASWQTSTMKLVLGGWNTLSTPVPLIESADTIDELISEDDMEIGYYYDGSWTQITTDYTLSPCDAVYVKMKSTASTAYVQLKFDCETFSTPSKDLAVGWNLCSLASLDSDGMRMDYAVASVALDSAGLPGYGQVISPSLNATRYDMYYNTGTSWASASGETTTAGTMYAGMGYWIYMQNAATLAGFEITPIAPDLD